MNYAEKYKLTFDHAYVGIAQISPLGKILEVNPEICRMTRFSREEILKLTVEDLTHPEDRSVTIQNFMDLNSGKVDAISMEKRYLRKDGGHFWASLDTRILFDVHDKPECLVSVVRDISLQKAAEFEREALAKLAELRKITGSLALNIREPLFEIIDHAEKIKVLSNKGKPENTMTHMSVRQIEENVEQIMKVVNALSILWEEDPSSAKKAD